MNIWRILSLKEEHIGSYRDMLSRDGGMVGDVIPISMGRRISTEIICGFAMLFIAAFDGNLLDGVLNLPSGLLTIFNIFKYILIFNVIIGVVNFILHTIGIRVLLSDLLYDMKDNKGGAVRQWAFTLLLIIFFWVSVFNVRSLDRTHFLVKQESFDVGDEVAYKNDNGNYTTAKVVAYVPPKYDYDFDSYTLDNGETIYKYGLKAVIEKKDHPFWILACDYEGVKNSMLGDQILNWMPEIHY